MGVKEQQALDPGQGHGVPRFRGSPAWNPGTPEPAGRTPALLTLGTAAPQSPEAPAGTPEPRTASSAAGLSLLRHRPQRVDEVAAASAAANAARRADERTTRIERERRDVL